MNIILDTNIYLWTFTDDSRLPKNFRQTLAENSAQCFISQASVWEIQIKYDLGKLNLPVAPNQLIELGKNQGNIQTLLLENEAIFLLSKLPQIHRDPFDRLIIAEAMHRGWYLATVDSQMRKYPVKLID